MIMYISGSNVNRTKTRWVGLLCLYLLDAAVGAGPLPCPAYEGVVERLRVSRLASPM